MHEKRKVFCISYGHFSNDVSTGAIPALLPFFVLAYGFSYTETAVIMFAYGIVSSIVQPLLGWMADRWRIRHLIAVGVLWTCVGLGCMGFIPCYWGILACALFTGVGSAIFHPEGARLANRLGGAHKALTMSLFAIGGNSGYALGPLVIGVLVPLFGMKSTLAFTVWGVVCAVALVRMFGEEPAPEKKKAATDGEEAVNDWRAFGILAGVVLSRSVLMSGFHAFLALYWMHQFEATASVGAAVLSGYGMMGVASNLFGGMISDRVGYVRVLRITQCLMLPALLAFAWTESSWVAIPMMLVIAFSLYCSYSPTVILGQTYLARNLGFSAGVTLGLTQTIGSLSLPLMGWISDTYDMRYAFLFMTIFVVIGVISSLFLKKTQYDR